MRYVKKGRINELLDDERLVFKIDGALDITKLCSGIVSKYKWRSPVSIIINTDLLDELYDKTAVLNEDSYISSVLTFTYDVPIILVLGRTLDDKLSNLLDEFLKRCVRYNNTIIIVDETDKDLLAYYKYPGISYIKLVDNNYYIILDETLLDIEYNKVKLFSNLDVSDYCKLVHASRIANNEKLNDKLIEERLKIISDYVQSENLSNV